MVTRDLLQAVDAVVGLDHFQAPQLLEGEVEELTHGRGVFDDENPMGHGLSFLLARLPIRARYELLCCYFVSSSINPWIVESFRSDSEYSFEAKVAVAAWPARSVNSS